MTTAEKIYGFDTDDFIQWSNKKYYDEGSITLYNLYKKGKLKRHPHDSRTLLWRYRLAE